MLGQALLDRMELVNAELQLQAGEANVTKGLLALNVAQDYFEAEAALRGKIFGSTKGTVVTAASTETTIYPAGLLRLDRMQLLDSTTSRPKRELYNIKRAGGHAWNTFWPLDIVSSSTTGEPRAYWADGSLIYWQPLPSSVVTVRWYGFSAAADITAAGTFAYPDIVAYPLAAYAVRLYKSGLDDNAGDVATLAAEVFRTVLYALAGFNRDGATGFEYTRVHET